MRKVHMLVLRRATSTDSDFNTKAKTAQWLCLCECGKEFVRTSQTIRVNPKTHCGCKTKQYKIGPVKHGESYGKGRAGSIRYTMLKAAAQRARRKGLDFDLKIKDIVVPSYCPILGIPLVKNANVAGPNSPSLDRIDNTKGYVRDNIAVISKKANNIKSDATGEELLQVARWVLKHERSRMS